MKNRNFAFQPRLKSLFYFLILVSLTVNFNCSPPSTDVVEITFGRGPDETGGAIRAQIDRFNQENKSKIRVVWKELSNYSNVQNKEIVADFKSSQPELDVIASDVIWTPQFASNGWVEDLSSRFFEEFNPGDFIEAAMESVSYNFHIWGIPWYTDTGILYYRKDLLEKSGYSAPPKTWSELIAMSQKAMQDSGTKFGFVFQGGDYEGGVTNAAEFIWNAGGDILFGDLSVSGTFDQAMIDPDIIMVNSPQAAKGLSDALAIVQSGIAPAEVTTYKENEAGASFQRGEAVFMRSWSSSYGFVLDPDSKVKPGMVGLTSLPVSEEGMESFSCLGGWNLMVNAKSSDKEKDAAWEFIKFMTNEANQKERCIKVGVLPTWRKVYEDEAFLKEAPVASFAKNVIPIARERPRSPYYMEMSPLISRIYSRVLKGELSPEAAVESMQEKLEIILELHN